MRGSVLRSAEPLDSTSVASSLTIDTGRGGSGATSLNRTGKHLVHDGLPAWSTSGHVGNEVGVCSTIGKLSAESTFDPSDVTIPVWPLPDWDKIWDVASGVKGPSGTIDEDASVSKDSEWSGVPSWSMESEMLVDEARS